MEGWRVAESPRVPGYSNTHCQRDQRQLLFLEAGGEISSAEGQGSGSRTSDYKSPYITPKIYDTCYIMVKAK